MQPGALVAVEIQERGGVLSALVLQIVGLGGSRCNWRHEDVDPLQRVIHQEPSLGDYMMSTAGVTAEQLHQIESLANDALVSIKAVIGNDNQHRFRCQRALLNRSPNPANQAVNLAYGG